jgi:hypothetical protein
MTQNTDKRNMDPGLRGQLDQNQIVNEQDQQQVVNPGPRESDERNRGTEEDTLIDHSFEKEGFEEDDSPEIDTPSRKEDAGEESTEKKIPHF